ncbi:MAG: magnesium transporter [Candidatus Aenigmarchaeota archaeon]|nr:magnesium transporter [Candidatus Aenigmarchaeota archaeon]
MVTKDIKEILPVEIISITGGLLAGTMLTFAAGEIYLIPGFLILLPGFLEMRGNISGSLSARLSAGLFLGAVKPKFAGGKILKGNIVASFALVVFLSLFLGMIAYAASSYFFGVAEIKIILIALIAGILSNVVEIPLTIMATFWLFRHGYDPNNIMGPYVTTTGDIISILSLLIAIVII